MQEPRPEFADARAGALAMAGLAAAVAPLAWLVAGAAGIAGTMAAVVVAGAYYAVSLLVVGPLCARYPAQALYVALGVYTVKVVAFGIVCFRLADAGVVDPVAFAATLVAATLLWCVVLVWRFARLPYAPAISTR